MSGFTFCCGDMGPAMEAKGTVTNEILEMIEDDPRVCYINADGSARGGKVQLKMEKYPGPFLCVRALDQIHNDVAYNDYPVRLIGTHAGISSGYGPTHNTIVEFGIMNAIPNMTMVAPCDAAQCKKLLRKSLEYPKPIYIRIPRGEEPLVYNEDYDYDYQIGKAIEIKEGRDLTIIGTGMGVYVGVLDMHTIKPIDKDAILKAAYKHSGRLLTVEDHNILGGLGSIVADVLLEAGVPAKLRKIGIPDTFVEFGYPEELYPYYGMDGPGVARTAKEFIQQ